MFVRLSFVALPPFTPPPSWPARLMALAAAGGFVVTVAHPSATRQFTWPWVLLLFLVWLAPLVAAFGGLPGRNPRARPDQLLGAGLLLLALTTLLSAALSPFARLSLPHIWPTLAGVALFFWLHDWLAAATGETGERSRRIARGLAWSGALLAAISFAGWGGRTDWALWSARNDFPFGHSTYTAGGLLLILPWLVSATLDSRGLRRAGWALMVLVAFLALLGTSSRGGVLAACAAGTLLTGFALVRAPWSRRSKAWVIGAAAGILGLAVLSNPRLRELVRSGGWGDSARESNTQRSAMLEAGWRLGAARPWTGWGPGTVPLSYPRVRHELSGGVDNVLQLHDTPVQLWATLGGGGVLALVLILVATLRRLRQLARRPSPLTLPAAASLFGYGLFALTDHQLDLPAMNALLVLNLALLFREEHPPETAPLTQGSPRLILLAGIVVLAGPLLFTGRDLLARYSFEQSLILFEHGRATEGREYLESAAQQAPYDPYYRHQLAARLWEDRARTSEPAARARLAAEAAGQLEQSLAAGCLQEFAHFNLGWLALETNEPARAVPHFRATLQEAPHRGGAYFGLGLALRGAGREADAIRAFALEWINDPENFTAPLWEWPDFAPLRPSVAREADRLLAELAPAHPTAGYIRELWNWWASGGPPPARGFNAETDAFAQALAAFSSHPPATVAPARYDWERLLDAWRQPPGPAVFAPFAPHDPAFTLALVRRAARHPPPDWRGFFTAGLENEPALLASQRPARTGYGVLARHPDGPVLTDLYVLQQNRVAARFAAPLFPPKGWLPARELLNRLPTLPASP